MNLSLIVNDFDIDNICKEDLLTPKLFDFLINIQDNYEQVQAITKVELLAKENKLVREFQKNFKAYRLGKINSQKSFGSNQTKFTNCIISLNCGEWESTDLGVIKKEMTNDFKVTIKKACEHPILPTEILINMDTDVEKIKLAFYKHEQWQTLICERVTTANNNKIIELANRGIEVNSENSKNLVSYIADCVALNLDKLPYNKALSRLGWVDNQFVPYDKDIRFDGEKENKFLFEAVHSKGELSDWVNYITPMRKNQYLRLLMAASFASPLIERIKGLSFVFHLWGGTGTGKTVGLMAAMSIWGNPKMGQMVRTMNMTANAMMSTSAFLHNLPFAGDELQTIKTNWNNYDQLIMKLTEGIDRGRMKYDQTSELKTWLCSFLFTGEEPCTKAESGGGVKNRVIEIECEHEVVKNGNHVVNFILDNYGTAGKVFIDYLKDIDSDILQARYKKIFDEILLSCDTEDKQALSMTFILLADELAGECIFKDEKKIEVKHIKKYVASSSDIDVTERAYQFTLSLISRQKNRFEENSNLGEYWGTLTENVCLINKDILIKELDERGFSFDAVKSKWANNGYLIKNSQDKFFHQTRCHGIKANYVKLNLEELPEIGEIFDK